PTIRVRVPVVIEGNGKTVSTTKSVGGNRIPANGKYNAAFIVLADNVEIRNVTIDNSGTNAHGIVVDKGRVGVRITGVSAVNGAAGIVANGSEVTVTDVRT